MLLLLFEVTADKLLHSPDRPASGFQALSAASLDMIESLLSQTVLSFSGSLSSHHSAHDYSFHLVQLHSPDPLPC